MTQLTLLPRNAWALDEETKRIGRTGLASAREVLAAKTDVRTPEADGAHDAAPVTLTAVAGTDTTETNRPIPAALLEAKHLLAA